ncbi:TIGR00270 family protein [Candidatus Thorarchaeota archaeon]|nr:MAG: TIGR00270 family protein [Candidatus Thorarchaeota archaeon]
MPSCELCGRGMKSQGRSVIIEGASMLVCPDCAIKFGGQSPSSSKRTVSRPKHSASWFGSPDRELVTKSPPQSIPKSPPKPKPRKSSGVLLDDLELIEDYAKVILTARQKLNISQDELSQKIGESISTLKAIEAGRQKPTERTIRGLERELAISLLEPLGTPPIKVAKSTSAGAGPTLGDRVIVKKKMSQKARKEDT